MIRGKDEKYDLFFSDILSFPLLVLFLYPSLLTFWRRNYFFNVSTPCVLNVNNTGTKYVRIMKQTAF